eukprot:gene41775-50993_t
MYSTQVYFGRTPQWRQTRHGGILLDLQQRPEPLFIMDEAMRIALINHLRERFDDIPGIESLQTTTQALEILQSAPDYLQVEKIAIMGFKFIEIHPSPVPEFAWHAYRNVKSDDAMKKVIISAVDAFLSLSLDEQEALTGSFFVFNAEGDGRVVTTVSELIDSAPTVFFHFGNIV